MPPAIKIDGMKFGRLTVFERVQNSHRGKSSWRCLCECGNEIITLGESLRKGRTKSCGCLNVEVDDMSGQRFGKLSVIKHVGRDKKRTSLWFCQCDCGNSSIVSSLNLRRGDTHSCGCLIGKNSKRITHGQSSTPEYRTWKSMIRRCEKPEISNYMNYGGRGIKVCSGWRNDASSFLADMGKRPGKQYSIDRIDNDANYSCGHCDECIDKKWSANCKWSTRIEQASNKRKRTTKQLTGHAADYEALPMFAGMTP